LGCQSWQQASFSLEGKKSDPEPDLFAMRQGSPILMYTCTRPMYKTTVIFCSFLHQELLKAKEKKRQLTNFSTLNFLNYSIL
jgi:hypothetical protein